MRLIKLTMHGILSAEDGRYESKIREGCRRLKWGFCV
jgi:hypothetical protein